MTKSEVVLSIFELSLGFSALENTNLVVEKAEFHIKKGEIVALIGESGSGKTLLAKSIIRLQPDDCQLINGSIVMNGIELNELSLAQIREYRGREIGLILQEPMVSLNPSMRVGEQMIEGLLLHTKLTKSEALQRAKTMLVKVGIPEPEKRLTQYAHELSGGLRQRIMIASVMLLKPKLVIADEPTTALDASVQNSVMQMLVELTSEINASVLLITHDLSVVADYANEVVVIEKGKVVEKGKCSKVFAKPKHPYTTKLLEALPIYKPKPLNVSESAPVVQINDVSVSFKSKAFFPWQESKIFRAVKSANLSILPGNVTALVGESGSGKSTLGRTVVGLCQPTSGSVELDGHRLYETSSAKRNLHPDIVQLIFQDPYSSLNPKMKLEEILYEGILQADLSYETRRKMAGDMLEEVDLPREFLKRYPHELSGGQRQRVCIARALISNPKLVVADEPVSALDLTVQSKVLKLLNRLQQERQFSMLFISHDLAVVQQLADTVVVMEHGVIVEKGATTDIFENAHHPYTRRLIEASPYLEKCHITQEYKLTTRRISNKTPKALNFCETLEFDDEETVFHQVNQHHSVLIKAIRT
ncbi:dipeptide ABC transporter ATP-binding protein [Alteromonas oceanisediminis]|uniref:dipeptide ABC transporter ATP-binding protein n=1 Tax=Alteromonas oceanisediminis TaxID=2836180 RepID=UPI001BD9E3D4|nr:ABC transporter ATP-binding protein [Alteromonas oceanisediminis]MBT0585173.1 ABC transporter ATP-binding protein [Alteromonas oceanisediminis]